MRPDYYAMARPLTFFSPAPLTPPHSRSQADKPPHLQCLSFPVNREAYSRDATTKCLRKAIISARTKRSRKERGIRTHENYWTHRRHWRGQEHGFAAVGGT